jgi:hypothetical protein
LLTVTLTGTLWKPTESELYTESDPVYAVALADRGSMVTVMVCGVCTLPPFPSDVCNHETVGTIEYMVMAAPVLVKVSCAVAPVFACVVMLSGLGLIFSVCACSAPVASKNTFRLRME